MKTRCSVDVHDSRVPGYDVRTVRVRPVPYACTAGTTQHILWSTRTLLCPGANVSMPLFCVATPRYQTSTWGLPAHPAHATTPDELAARL